MQQVSMHDLEQFSYWQEKRLTSSHWYNIYNPVISVELTELADHVVRNNDAVEEIQLDLTVQQHRVPAWNESLLMSMSDALLRSLQRWITDHGYENAMLSLTPSCGTTTTTNNQMFRRANKYSNVYFLSMESVSHKNFISHVGLAKSKMVDGPTINTMHGI